MSYERKDEIIMNLKDYHAGRRVVTGGINAFESKLSELDHVYAQAPKADEYEAKAKAFDEIFKLYIGYEDGWIHFPKGNRSFIEDIINVCKKYESEELDE